ncbi:mitochondrial seryl-tRNA synthetase [Ophiocordyceps camponoti-floridani]|uniref:Mitochondrial seryl-tRNA synthetase n=1 Tax=Ophiocordyceps camponoti-floridani TaxID=2030778 RepID=A0A8H4Q5G8_9HYPO|nr:mitochondrial seryl-tRNA synthetase [Ophiocordyceps camponoti-floridani]
MFRNSLLRPRLRALPLRSKRRHASSFTSRIDKLTSKLPPRWQKYATRLRTAPASHIAAFVVLHEVTAIVPLLALFALFHNTAIVPVDWVAARFASYTDEGVARLERYFRRERLFGFQPESLEEVHGPGHEHMEQAMQRRDDGDRSYGILVDVALAYAVTKVLLPVRILASLLATPWLARIMTSIGNSLSRKL